MSELRQHLPMVSLFSGCMGRTPIKSVTMGTVIDRVRGDYLKARISALRAVLSTEGKGAYNESKKDLPAVTIAGVMAPTRGNENLSRPSSLGVVDLDGLCETLQTARTAAAADPNVLFAFVSPSGDGLKVIYRID
jgi:hypothetical protein